MKVHLLLIFMLAFATSLFSQNEFAARAFYTDFIIICEDAANGFSSLKGKERISEYPGLTKEYEINLLLPLADSAKIIIAENKKPQAIFYFEPSKLRLKTDQKGANLREAITIAYGKPLSARTETFLVDDTPVSNTWFFEGTDEQPKQQALFIIGIYNREELYYLSLQINGK